MDTLPNEILIEILTRCSYWDLTIRVPLVCRRFHELLKPSESGSSRSVVDKCLFRDAPPLQNQGDQRMMYTPHPVFNLLYYRWTVSVFDVDVHYDGRVGPVPCKKFVKLPLGDDRILWGREWLAGSKIGKENAVSPPVKNALIQLSLTRQRSVKGTGRNGAVTVLDVMENMMRKKYGSHWYPMIALQNTWKGIGRAEQVEGVLCLYPEFATVTEEDREYTRLYKATYGFRRSLPWVGWAKLRRLRMSPLFKGLVSAIVSCLAMYFYRALSKILGPIWSNGRFCFILAIPFAYDALPPPKSSVMVVSNLLAYVSSFFEYPDFRVSVFFSGLSIVMFMTSARVWSRMPFPQIILPLYASMFHIIPSLRSSKTGQKRNILPPWLDAYPSQTAIALLLAWIIIIFSRSHNLAVVFAVIIIWSWVMRQL